MSEANEELHRMIDDDELRDAILLVFANKQDLPNAMNAAEITDKLGLHGLRQRTWYIQVSTLQLSFENAISDCLISRPHVRPVEMVCTKASNGYVFRSGLHLNSTEVIITSDSCLPTSSDETRGTVFRLDWIWNRFPPVVHLCHDQPTHVRPLNP